MAHLLFAAHDSGGANMLGPVMPLARESGHRTSAMAAGPAMAIWRDAGEEVVDAGGGLPSPNDPSPDLPSPAEAGFAKAGGLWPAGRSSGFAQAGASRRREGSPSAFAKASADTPTPKRLRVVVRAVWCEPVSGAGTAISLLNREKTGNFFKNSLIWTQILR